MGKYYVTFTKNLTLRQLYLTEINFDLFFSFLSNSIKQTVVGWTIRLNTYKYRDNLMEPS